jgi:hypothetical protein
MRFLPVLQPLVGVFDHHDRRVHHRPYRDSDAAKRHDVGVQPLEVHDDKGNAQPQRQRDNRHQRRTHVPENSAQTTATTINSSISFERRLSIARSISWLRS